MHLFAKKKVHLVAEYNKSLPKVCDVITGDLRGPGLLRRLAGAQTALTLCPRIPSVPSFERIAGRENQKEKVPMLYHSFQLLLVLKHATQGAWQEIARLNKGLLALQPHGVHAVVR